MAVGVLLTIKKTRNGVLHLRSYFVIIKECWSPVIPAARGASVIT
jgi:hypothetical protein